MKNFYFQKIVLHPKSQFTMVKNGSNACTYISMEASLYLLSSLIFDDAPTEENGAIIYNIVSNGAKLYNQYETIRGNKSCDEVYNKAKRFQKYLKVISTCHGKLKDGTSFGTLLDLSKKKYEEGERNCMIVTKPPETICVSYDPKKNYPYIIFDSHPRNFIPTKNKGSGFYFFQTKEDCVCHLKQLFYNFNVINHNDYNQISQSMFETTFLKLTGNGFDQKLESDKKLKQNIQNKNYPSLNLVNKNINQHQNIQNNQQIYQQQQQQQQQHYQQKQKQIQVKVQQGNGYFLPPQIKKQLDDLMKQNKLYQNKITQKNKEIISLKTKLLEKESLIQNIQKLILQSNK